MIHAEHADNAALLNALSGRVIGCAFTVLNAPGAGFLEKVYENSLAIELREAGLRIVQRRQNFGSALIGQYSLSAMTFGTRISIEGDLKTCSILRPRSRGRDRPRA